MHETSIKIIAGVAFWVDAGEMMRFRPRDDIAGLTEGRLVPELAAVLKASIQVFNARGTHF